MIWTGEGRGVEGVGRAGRLLAILVAVCAGVGVAHLLILAANVVADSVAR